MRSALSIFAKIKLTVITCFWVFLYASINHGEIGKTKLKSTYLSAFA